MFGVIDIMGSCQKHEYETEDWHQHKACIQRQFTVRSQCDTDVLLFSYNDLHRMTHEFSEYYDVLLDEAFSLFRRVLLVKLLAMKQCRGISRKADMKNLTHLKQSNTLALINPMNTLGVGYQFDAFNLQEI